MALWPLYECQEGRIFLENLEQGRYKIIFSDIDGTFLNSRHEVLPGTERAVRQLVAAGTPVVLVSARMPEAILPITEKMGIEIPLISYSGALVLTRTGEMLYSHTMPAEPTARILAAIEKRWPAVTLNYYAGHHWYVKDTQAPAVQREERITSAASEQADFAALMAQGILPHKILCMSEPAVNEAMERELTAAFPELNVVRSCDILLEIMDKGITKSQGIAVLLKHFGLVAADALAFGDNYNDVDMLEFVGTGVAMGNAPQDIKAIADAVTATNDEEGIAKYLAKQTTVDC